VSGNHADSTIRLKGCLSARFLTFKCEEESEWDAAYPGSLCGSVTGSPSGTIMDAKGSVVVT